jgi:hypothetical protein
VRPPASCLFLSRVAPFRYFLDLADGWSATRFVTL